jgi:hypothetical protein
VKESGARLDDNVRQVGAQSGLRVAAPAPKSKSPPRALESAFQQRADQRDDGIEVHEHELGSVMAQRLYKMRCECGRSWFELELPKLVQCPACLKLNLVSI